MLYADPGVQLSGAALGLDLGASARCRGDRCNTGLLRCTDQPGRSTGCLSADMQLPPKVGSLATTNRPKLRIRRIAVSSSSKLPLLSLASQSHGS